MRTRRLRIFVTLITMMLIAAACGDSGDTTTTQAPTTQPPATDPPATDPPPTTQAPDPFDVDGDGLVTIGIAAAGPRDDGGYYQAVVDGAQTFAASQGSHWTVIISDNITAEDAATAIDDLAQQSVDIMIVGASEIASPMADLAEKHSDAFWYCNCGAGWPESPFYAQSQDDGSEIHYTVGVAAGLLMQEAGGDSMVMLGCCDLGFEKEAFLATQMGLQAVDPTFTITYVQTGGFPFDFENTANAIEAFNNALAEGVVGVYGYLGGAANPVGQAANEADIFNIAAGPGDACTRTDVAWSMTAAFDGGEYVAAIFPQIISGDIVEGSIKLFRVGVDPEPGARMCNATAEQQAALDAAYALVGTGDLAGDFGAIKGQAYG